jgi:hypothetical protein
MDGAMDSSVQLGGSIPSQTPLQGAMPTPSGKGRKSPSIDGLAYTQPHARNTRKRRRAVAAFLVGCIGLTASSGCTRSYYRQRADAEAYALIDEKVAASCEQPGKSLRIEPDQRSRFFDPFERDRPPMPEDDPRSHRYMHCVDGKKGYPLWHVNGETNTAENPDWYAYLPIDERGVLTLDMDQSVELALIHSPEYQQQLETLYLSALDVSSERFRFDTQFFAGYNAFLQADAAERTGSGESSTTVTTGPFSRGRRPLAIQRTFTTGADLVVGVANSIVWEVSGPNTQSANTVLDFSLIQPLLRGAGRDRIMEQLTRSERNLLANIRAFEQFRRSFYLNITIGRQLDQGARRAGGLFGVGLQGFTGLGSGFAGLGGGGGAGGFGAGGGAAGVPQAGGILGLLQDQLQIQNQEENVARLRENLLVLEDTLRELLTTIPTDQEEIPRQRLQVAQQRSALLTAENQLITTRTRYQASIDTFLSDLGLPPYICTEINDPLLKQFLLISTDLKQRRNDVADARTAVGDINFAILELAKEAKDEATGVPVRSIGWSNDLDLQLKNVIESLQPISQLQSKMADSDLPEVMSDLEKLAEVLPERKSRSEKLAEKFRRNKEQICNLLPTPNFDEAVFDTSGLSGLNDELDRDYKSLQKRIDDYKGKIAKLGQDIEKLRLEGQSGALKDQKLFEAIRDRVVLATQDMLGLISDDVLLLQLLQARARTESVVLPEIDLEPRQALEIARENRRDWANARAALVDAWRLIEFNADDLESTLDVVFSGDMRNQGDNPLNLDASTGRLRVGLQWDSPITRIQERNTYRQSLIDFQQARRTFYQFEDSVWQQLRGSLRQVQANQVNFELQRNAVRIAAEQISLNEDIRQLRDSRGLSSGPTAARDIIFALNDLLTAQNAFLDIWVNYEVLRRGLDFDLGTMQLSPDGDWIDPGAIRPDTLIPAVTALPPASTYGGNDCAPRGCPGGACGGGMGISPALGSNPADRPAEMVVQEVELAPSAEPAPVMVDPNGARIQGTDPAADSQ